VATPIKWLVALSSPFCRPTAAAPSPHLTLALVSSCLLSSPLKSLKYPQESVITLASRPGYPVFASAMAPILVLDSSQGSLILGSLSPMCSTWVICDTTSSAIDILPLKLSVCMGLQQRARAIESDGYLRNVNFCASFLYVGLGTGSGRPGGFPGRVARVRVAGRWARGPGGTCYPTRGLPGRCGYR
jgi:hypothetical protein